MTLPPERRAELLALCEKATPGQRYQFAHKYASFDRGETPQVFRSISQADEGLIIATDPDTVRALLASAEDAERLRAALEAIANSPHCSYEHNKNPNMMGEYNTGVVDGHRCAAQMARAALAPASPDEASR